jgi:hypothetical protein
MIAVGLVAIWTTGLVAGALWFVADWVEPVWVQADEAATNIVKSANVLRMDCPRRVQKKLRNAALYDSGGHRFLMTDEGSRQVVLRLWRL